MPLDELVPRGHPPFRALIETMLKKHAANGGAANAADAQFFEFAENAPIAIGSRGDMRNICCERMGEFPILSPSYFLMHAPPKRRLQFDNVTRYKRWHTSRHLQ